jgi:hypothetical protein
MFQFPRMETFSFHKKLPIPRTEIFRDFQEMGQTYKSKRNSKEQEEQKNEAFKVLFGTTITNSSKNMMCPHFLVTGLEFIEEKCKISIF